MNLQIKKLLTPFSLLLGCFVGSVWSLPIAPDDEIIIYSKNNRAGLPPDLVRLNNGDLLCSFREAGNHLDIAGSIGFMRSTDDGQTWGELQIIQPAQRPPIDFRDPSITELSDGDLLCTFFSYAGSIHSLEGMSEEKIKKRNARRTGNTIYVLHSMDGGKTWPLSAKLDLEQLNFDWALTTEKCLQLKSGRILMPVFCGTADKKHQIAGLLASDDNGHSWFHLSAAQKEVWEIYRPYSLESSLVQAANENLVLVSRTKTRGMLIAYSDDDGVTWKDQRIMPEMASSTQPNLCHLSDGRLLLSFGNRGLNHDGRRAPPPYHIECRVSDDHGRTWGQPRIIRNHLPNMDMGYPTIQQINTDTAYVAYWICLGKEFEGPYITAGRSLSLNEL